MLKFGISIILLIFSITAAASTNQDLLTNIFARKKYRYTIRYPSHWSLHDLGKGVVLFKGKSMHPSYEWSVNIQTIYTKKGGGKYKTIKDLMDDFQSQVPLHTERAKFLERKSITLMQSDGAKFNGEETVLTFYENGKTLKHWQVMFMSQDGNLFQAWAYRAPLPYYDLNYPLAAAMLASWVID